MVAPLIFTATPPYPGVARSVAAFVPTPGEHLEDGEYSPLLMVTTSLNGAYVGLQWITDDNAHAMLFTAAQARSVAAELITCAGEADRLVWAAAAEPEEDVP